MFFCAWCYEEVWVTRNDANMRDAIVKHLLGHRGFVMNCARQEILTPNSSSVAVFCQDVRCINCIVDRHILDQQIATQAMWKILDS